MGGVNLLAFHALSSAMTNYMVYWVFTSAKDKPYVDNIVQLTVISLLSINVYYFVVLYQDFKNLFSKSTKNNNDKLPYGNKTYLFFQTIFAMAHIVAIAYWALRLQDIRLVVPESEIHLVDWRSSYTHGLNLIPLYIELALFTQTLPKNRGWKILHYFQLTSSYIVIQYLYFLTSGRQVYPFLSALPLWIVGAFYSSLFLFLLVIDVWACYLIVTFHGSAQEEAEGKEKLAKIVPNKKKL